MKKLLVIALLSLLSISIRSSDLSCQKKDKDSLNKALLWAATCRDFKQVKHLLKQGADPNYKDKHGIDARCWAIYDNDQYMIDLLERYGSKKDKDSLNKALLRAATCRDFKQVKYLLKQGADPNYKNKHGIDARYWAIYDNDQYMIDLLARYRSKRDKDSLGEALLEAAMFGDVEETENLLNQGADSDYRNAHNVDARYLAGLAKSEKVINLLERYARFKQRSAVIFSGHKKDKELNEKLLRAVEGHYSLSQIEDLLKQGADVTYMGTDGAEMTVSDYVMASGDANLQELFRKYGSQSLAVSQATSSASVTMQVKTDMFSLQTQVKDTKSELVKVLEKLSYNSHDFNDIKKSVKEDLYRLQEVSGILIDFKSTKKHEGDACDSSMQEYMQNELHKIQANIDLYQKEISHCNPTISCLKNRQAKSNTRDSRKIIIMTRQEQLQTLMDKYTVLQAKKKQ